MVQGREKIRREAESVIAEPDRRYKERGWLFPMNLRERIRDSSQPIYFLGQNPITLTGAVITTQHGAYHDRLLVL